jgi:ubiquinone/menaquinone biosynthesis C-methylase UbiE
MAQPTEVLGASRSLRESAKDCRPPPPANFDGLARVYHALEWLAFGRALERTRFSLMEELRGCADILLLGDGDGRGLARLARVAPGARLHYLDASPAMLVRAEARLAAGDRHRVTFTCANALDHAFPERSYDAVVTLFFLDVFTPEQVRALVARVQPSLRPGARWLYADFVLPPRGPPRWRASAWLRIMYTFFCWQTRMVARALPPTEKIFHAAGWRVSAARDFSGVFARSVLFSQPGSGT